VNSKIKETLDGITSWDVITCQSPEFAAHLEGRAKDYKDLSPQQVAVALLDARDFVYEEAMDRARSLPSNDDIAQTLTDRPTTEDIRNELSIPVVRFRQFLKFFVLGMLIAVSPFLAAEFIPGFLGPWPLHVFATINPGTYQLDDYHYISGIWGPVLFAFFFVAPVSGILMALASPFLLTSLPMEKPAAAYLRQHLKLTGMWFIRIVIGLLLITPFIDAYDSSIWIGMIIFCIQVNGHALLSAWPDCLKTWVVVFLLFGYGRNGITLPKYLLSLPCFAREEIEYKLPPFTTRREAASNGLYLVLGLAYSGLRAILSFLVVNYTSLPEDENAPLPD
jgi:hypothetical protein